MACNVTNMYFEYFGALTMCLQFCAQVFRNAVFHSWKFAPSQNLVLFRLKWFIIIMNLTNDRGLAIFFWSEILSQLIFIRSYNKIQWAGLASSILESKIHSQDYFNSFLKYDTLN